MGLGKRTKKKGMKRHCTKRPPWKKMELRLLRDLYSHTPNAVIAARLKRTKGSIDVKAHYLDLHKTRKYLIRSGRMNLKKRGGVWGRMNIKNGRCSQ